MICILDAIPLSVRNKNTDDILGAGAIKGQVREIGIPIPCRVRLFEKLSGRLIADVLTDVNGNYKFDHLTKTRFFLVAHHPENQYNAVIQDNVIPK